MAVKIRLQRHGRKKNPYYKIVVADARSPRDGRFIERLGFYNPMTVPATIEIDREKALDWIQKGAQPTDTVRAILRFKGVLFRKHLLRGVAKGALTEEQADTQWAAFVQEKEAKVEARREKVAEEKVSFHTKVSGTPKAIPVPVVEEEAPAPPADDAQAEEAPAADVVAPTEEVAEVAAPAEEAAPEEVAEEAAPTEDATPAEEAPVAEVAPEEAAPAEETAATEPEPEAPSEDAPATEETEEDKADA